MIQYLVFESGSILKIRNMHAYKTVHVSTERNAIYLLCWLYKDIKPRLKEEGLQLFDA